MQLFKRSNQGIIWGTSIYCESTIGLDRGEDNIHYDSSMNFVAHLFLSPRNDAIRVGTILADFTVGKMDAMELRYGKAIAIGIKHHREVDRFTDSHRAVINCVDQMQETFGIYGGIVLDVMFDHFLLNNWQQFSSISLNPFFDSVYKSLSLMRPDFPERYKLVVNRMLERRWLHTYAELENVAYALGRVGERFQRETPLSNTLPGLKKHYDVMERSFLLFFPQLQRFSDSLVTEMTNRNPAWMAQ